MSSGYLRRHDQPNLLISHRLVLQGLYPPLISIQIVNTENLNRAIVIFLMAELKKTGLTRDINRNSKLDLHQQRRDSSLS